MEDFANTAFDAVPIPMLQVDATATGEVARYVRNKGIDDIPDFLISRPDLIAHMYQAVSIKRANAAALALMGAGKESDLHGSINELIYGAAPQARLRLLQSRLASRKNHSDVFAVPRLDEGVINVSYNVAFPDPFERDQTAFVVMFECSPPGAIVDPSGRFGGIGDVGPRAKLGMHTAQAVHDLKQPLAAMIASGDACRRWLDRPHPDLGKAIRQNERVIESAIQFVELLNKMVSYPPPPGEG